jgi:hypothetical protein
LDVAFAGASEFLTVRLLPKSQSGLTLASPASGARSASNVILKVARTKWDAHRLPLQPGDVVTLGLKSYKLLRA